MNPDADLRMTKTTIAVLEVLLAATDDRPVWNHSIANAADMEPSSVSMIVKRLRERGWVESWPAEEDGFVGRRRMFHELTPVGHQGAIKALLRRQKRRRMQGFD